MYKAFIRTFYFFVNPVHKFYWFLFRPKTRGVKVVIEYDRKFLLTRLGYAHKKWTIPGGGVKRSERWEEAARREAFEETGIKIGEMRKVGEYTNTKEYKRDTVVVFHALVPTSDFKIDGIEIVEAAWFSPDTLPVDRAQRVEELIKMAQEDFG